MNIGWAVVWKRNGSVATSSCPTCTTTGFHFVYRTCREGQRAGVPALGPATPGRPATAGTDRPWRAAISPPRAAELGRGLAGLAVRGGAVEQALGDQFAHHPAQAEGEAGTFLGGQAGENARLP